MMFPDGPMGNPQQHPGGVTAPPMPPPPMGPGGHQGGASPGMPPQHHPQQHMNPGFPHPQRRHSSGMPGQFPHMPPQSPAGGRQPSFGNMQGGHQGNPYSHPPMQSPATQQQPGPMPGMHHNMGGRRQSGNMPGSHSHQGMGMGMPPQHDQMRPPSNNSYRQNVGNPMGNPMNPQQHSMGGSNNSGSMNSGGGGGGGGGGNSSGWQSEKDTQHRREMIQHIVKLLKKDKNGSPESLSKLPQMAKQLEVSLYRNARSFEAYMDSSTLKARLQQIAVEVSRKAPSRMRSSQGGGSSSDNRDERHWNDRQQSSSSQQQFSNGNRRPPDSQMQRGSSTSPFMGNSGQQMQQRGVVNLDDINPMASSGGGGSSRGHSGSSNYNSSSGRGASDQRPSGSSQSGGAPQNRNDPEWKIRIRHKQQRLLLLHHSAKCPHEDGRCTVTPHCADMKRLWRHMEGCKDNNCRVSHCFSSRAILSHYRKCKDANCPACGPVRDTVKKSSQSRTPSSRSGRSGTGGSAQQMMGGNMMSGNIGPMGSTLGTSSMGGGNSMNNNSMPMNGSMSNSMNNPMASNMGGGPTSLQRGMSNGMPPGGPVMQGNDPMSSGGGNFNSGSSSMNNYQQQPNRNMPPPVGGPVANNMPPFNSSSNSQSSRYRSGSTDRGSGGGGGATSSSAQPMYQSDRPSSSSRERPSSSSASAPPPVNDSGNPASLSASASQPSGSKRNDSEWQKVRHKQQRLLLLRHASRCQFEAGKCPVTPHCASMKELWKHIAHCKDQQCSVQHCMSSRYVLSHYRRCKDAKCPACGPVRETIRKSHEKEKNSRGGSGSGSNQPASFDIDMSSRSNKSQRTENIQSSSSQKNDQPMPPLAQQPPPASMASSGATSPPVSSPSTSFGEPQPKRARTGPSEQELSSAALPTTSSSGAPSAAAAVAPVSSGQSAEKVTSAPPKDPTPPAPKPVEVVPSDPAPKVTPKVAPKGNIDRSLLKSFSKQELETHLASLNRQTQLPPAKLKAKCLEVLKGLQTHQHGWVFNVPVDPVELGLPDYFDIIKKPMDLGTIHKRLDTGNYHDIDNFQADCNLVFDNAMTYNEEGSVVYEMAKELKDRFEIDFKKLLGQLAAEDKERRQNERACTLCGCEKLLFEPPVFFCNGMNCQSTRIRRNSHFYVGGNNQYFWCNQCFNELDDKIPIELVDMTITKADLKKKKNDEVHEESWVQCDCCERWVHQICGLFNTRQNKEHHSEYCCPQCLLDKHKSKKTTQNPKPMGAADLPRTILSEWLEQHIAKRVGARKRELAEDKAKTENIPLEDAIKYVESGGPIIIRQVTAMDRKLEVRELMRKRYEHKKYPEEFPFRCKCIVVFQHLDGVDVILFALYVYEHGEDNPPPNQRCVYISYLDSVHFMRPRRLRTFVYHEILIAYLDYARRRGFATAHIWACPPLKGDDYIFYAKPEDQKTPRDSRLRQWYIDMLVDCQRRDIVGKVTNMYDLYFADESIDATAVPYLEGDYFPGEAENIIKMIEDGGGKKGSGGGSKKKKSKNSTSKQRGGTRATGLDEEALLASGMLDAKNLAELDRDQVMVKLGETIQPMKDSFIVAFLNWKGIKPHELEIPDDIAKWRRENPDKLVKADLSGSKREAFADVLSAKDNDGNPVKVIDDDDEDLDCEFLNNRQAFLNLCRGNHYQFDELRRAKHTSMMVLWHLHNRDAPKFVQQCVVCSREILSGKRYHCNQCTDYDLCEECYKDPKVNRGSCNHKLVPIAVEAQSEDGNSSGSNLTEAQRQQRQRNLMLHIQLIEHASRCKNPNCSSSNCVKMKNYLQHARLCKVKVTGGCKICKRIWTLLRIHAQKCKESVCPIPQCMAIREKMRQLQRQQQAMDDRRRLEMNRHRMAQFNQSQ